MLSYVFNLIFLKYFSMIKMKYGKRRKSKRLAKKGTTHYEEAVISDDDDYICECNITHDDIKRKVKVLKTM